MSDNTPDNPDSHVDGSEPSMEDILASIRRIIADDDKASAPLEAGAKVEAAVEVASAPVPKDFQEIKEFNEADIVPLDAVSSGEPVMTRPDDVTDFLPGDDELGIDEVLDIDDLLALDGDDVTLTELDSLQSSDDLNAIETLLDEDNNEAEAEAEPLTGLAGIAAAGLGAAAAAGAGVASAITSERQSPKIERSGSEKEKLDLVLDSIGDDRPSDDLDLQDLLQIPDGSDGEQAPELDDVDKLLNDLLGDSPSDEVSASDHLVVDPAADLLNMQDDGDDLEALLETIEQSNTVLEDNAAPDSDPDLDLVKSLMADLTDDPYPGGGEDSQNAEAIADEILPLSMVDEAKLQDALPEGDMVEALGMGDEQNESSNGEGDDNSPFFIDINADLSQASESKPSLSDIASSAKADAERIKSRGFSPGQFAAGAGIAVAATGPLAALVGKADERAKSQSAPAAEPANETVHTDDADVIEELLNPEHDQITPTQEIAEMAKASAKEKIVDTVTEDATSSAFASLNQVVDDKATMADRGDRIGDLVQEALRPMLKEWLDKNLKGIVERAVTKEVKRISSGK